MYTLDFLMKMLIRKCLLFWKVLHICEVEVVYKFVEVDFVYHNITITLLQCVCLTFRFSVMFQY